MSNYLEVSKLIEQNLDLNTINILTDVPVSEIELIAANMELESNMKTLGKARYLARQEALRNKGADLDTDTKLIKIKKMLKPLASAIADYRDSYKSFRPNIAVEVLKRHDEYALALQTIRICIMAETTGKNELAALCTRLADSIETGLDTPQQYRVGYKLIDLMVKQSDACFEVQKLFSNNVTTHLLKATETFYEWEETLEDELGDLAVMYRPMVMPPRPWTGLHSGGYWSQDLQQSFIRNAPKATNKSHGMQVMPMVYEAVNMIQATPFTVNKFVLDVANELVFDDELFFDGWYEELPERPHNVRTKDLQAIIDSHNEALGITPENRVKHGNTFGQWVRDMLASIGPDSDLYKVKQELEEARFKMVQYVKWRKKMTSVKSKNRVIKTALETANDYRDYPAIYFPANLDWRGRVYPMCAGLTTQGVCLQKALIKFAAGKPIGSQEALDWLFVHTANCFGKDKASWNDRLQWTKDNRELIERIAGDPLDNVEDWIHTDEPWLFLAACEQMAKYYEHGLDAVVDIPIPMDGTCNGAQHYAAMTRDLEGAYAVNVAPNGTQGLKARLTELRAKLETTNPTGV